MKKIVLLVFLSLICVYVFAAGIKEPTKFDPTVTPVEGEWINFDPNYNVLKFKFTGNRWEFTYRDVYLTGLFNYNNKEVLFTNENGKWTQGYEFKGSYRFFIPEMGYKGRVQTYAWGYFTKQPYGDLVRSYLTKEKLFSDIVTNENELARIQGSWKSNYNNGRVVYTFSGDRFTVNAPGKRLVTGTVKIRDNVLYLIVTDEQFGMFYLDFSPDNKIFLNELWSYFDLWWGEFIKQ